MYPRSSSRISASRTAGRLLPVAEAMSGSLAAALRDRWIAHGPTALLDGIGAPWSVPPTSQ